MTPTRSHGWWIGPERSLDTASTLVMGVLNVTPDSFHDGGRFDDDARAVRQGLDLVSEGADIIDIGGESTRPGAERVAPGEQIRRTAGVISGLRARSDVAISIDTTLAPVALAALEASRRSGKNK